MADIKQAAIEPVLDANAICSRDVVTLYAVVNAVCS